jgi:hypothetical protein
MSYFIGTNAVVGFEVSTAFETSTSKYRVMVTPP